MASSSSSPHGGEVPSASGSASSQPPTRPQDSVDGGRLEGNWRAGRYQMRTLQGHTDGIMCLQYSENLPNTDFPVLVTGSYDRTARVWNLETGEELRALAGHTRGVRCLQFDETKLITGSMDRTLKIWNWRTGELMRTLEGHDAGILCLHFNDEILVSGSADGKITVWNFHSDESFTLKGHDDWVNAVQLWSPVTAVDADADRDGTSNNPASFLFSASDDCTIRLWDLQHRECLMTYEGYVGQVQSIKLVMLDEDALLKLSMGATGGPGTSQEQSGRLDKQHLQRQLHVASICEQLQDLQERFSAAGLEYRASFKQWPVLLSGSLDNTLKIFDVRTGRCMRTLSGHLEGVWSLDVDKLRIVSASHDKTIKIWDRDTAHCQNTLVGHRAAVTCVALGDDKIVSGSDDSEIRIWSFAQD